MTINKRKRRINQRGLQDAITHLDRLADKLLCSNRQCFVPETKGKKHSKKMGNCHIIAKGYLGRISNIKTTRRAEVLCWPLSFRTIGRLAKREIDEGRYALDPMSISIGEYTSANRSKNHKDCELTLACENHDNKVFKLIDTVAQLNLDNLETRFLLGFRSIAAYTALYEGYKRWTQYDFKKDKKLRQCLKNHPTPAAVYENIKQFGESTITVSQKINDEMNRWQTAYKESDWKRAVTTMKTVSPTLRIAGTGIVGTYNYPIIITLLPTENSRCTIIATCLDRGIIPRIPQRLATRHVVRKWAKRIADESPKSWLPDLAQDCEYLYVSPDDYYNLDRDGQLEIERAMARKIPTIRF